MKILMILGHDPIYPYEDGRVIKEAKSLVNLGNSVTILSWSMSKPKEIDYKGIKIIRSSIFPYPKNFILKIMIKLMNFFVSIGRAIQCEYDAIHCHDFETLPMGVLLKIVSGKILVYDAHELEADRPKRKFLSNIIPFMESSSMMFVDILITANGHRLKIMKQRYNLKNVKTHIIHNYSDLELKPNLNIQREKIYLSITGPINKWKPVEPFIKSLKVNPNIVIFYFGKDGDKIKKMSKKYNTTDQVRIIGVIPRSKYHEYMTKMDGAIISFTNYPLNNLYCEPNRVYDALSAGNFIIATNNPTLMFIKNDGLGFNIDFSLKESDIIKIYKKLNRKFVNKLRRNVLKKREEYLWQKNDKILKKIYPVI